MRIERHKKILAIVLVLSFLVPSSLLFSPHKAEAFGGVSDTVHIITDTSPTSIGILGGTITIATKLGLLTQKEITIDSIFFSIAKIAIRAVTASIINWINSGFEGNPAFVTDLEGFLLDTANEVIGEFIFSSDLAFLCSPFDIRFALAIQFGTPFERKVQCTLTDVIDNIDDFVAGDFASGGWDGWFELTTKPKNNPYGAFIEAKFELESRIESEKDREKQKLDFGSGFFSWEECDERTVGDAGSSMTPLLTEKTNCQIATPGTAIEGQLENVLGSGVRQLELADEFNEIIGALITQLAFQALTSLRGTSKRSFSQPSFVAQLQSGNTEADRTIVNNSKENALDDIQSELAVELELKDVRQGTLDSVLASEALLKELYECYEDKSEDTSLTLIQRDTALDRALQASSTIQSRIIPLEKEYTDLIAFLNINIGKLNLVQSATDSSETVFELKEAVEDLIALQESGDLHDISDLVNARTERNGRQSELAGLNGETQQKINECSIFPEEIGVTLGGGGR